MEGPDVKPIYLIVSEMRVKLARSHFDLRAPAAHGGKGPTAASKRDYLRIYYSDYLSQRPVDHEDRPKFADPTESSIESEDLKGE